MPTSPPVALTIAGSDCSAGAGIQADLKTFSGFGVYGLTAVTCVVAEVPGKVGSIVPVPPEVLAEQLALLNAAFPIAAVKTGLLYSIEHVNVVVDWLHSLERLPPLVIDPVMVASTGDSLLKDEALAMFNSMYNHNLLPGATLVTPNLDEAVALGAAPIDDQDGLLAAARHLAAKFSTRVLVKGGHLCGELAIDAMADPAGNTHLVRAPFTPGVSTHGSGCTYSAAIAAGLATGCDVPSAVAHAKRFVTESISDYFRWGETDALNHIFES